MITRIKVENKFASLDTYFVWENVPKFAVIAGINGSGKTKLLEYVNQSCSNRNHNAVTVSIDLHGRVQFVQINQGFGSLNQAVSSSQVESRFTQVVSYVKSGQKNNPEWEKLLGVIAQQLSQPRENMHLMPLEKIVAAVPPDAVLYMENGFNNQYISEIFKSYQEKIRHIRDEYYDYEKKDRPTTEQIYDIIGFPPPWDTTNAIFAKYGFIYRMNLPTKEIHYSPLFIDTKNPKNDSVTFDQLSSGEKIIVSLILWSYNKQLGEKNKVFLLDEFDAHLNPSMSKMFVEIIKEKLVGEFGMQVIMTTHSPSTVAHVNDEDLFWLERGKNIQKSSRSEIIPILSDGIMTYQEASGLLECIIRSQKPIVLFTEGVTDITHIQTAREKLAVRDAFDIFPCNCADKLRQFLIGCPSALFGDKKVIGLFDHDEEGLKKTKKGFTVIIENLYGRGNDNIYAVLLPVPQKDFAKYQNCPIEFLYSKNILETHGMLAGKRSITDVNKYEGDNPMNTNDYETRDDLWFYKLNNNKKKEFAQNIGELSKEEFINFKGLVA